MASATRTTLKTQGQQDEDVVEGAAVEELDVTMFVTEEAIKKEFNARDSTRHLILSLKVSSFDRRHLHGCKQPCLLFRYFSLFN